MGNHHSTINGSRKRKSKDLTKDTTACPCLSTREPYRITTAQDQETFEKVTLQEVAIAASTATHAHLHKHHRSDTLLQDAIAEGRRAGEHTSHRFTYETASTFGTLRFQVLVRDVAFRAAVAAARKYAQGVKGYSTRMVDVLARSYEEAAKAAGEFRLAEQLERRGYGGEEEEETVVVEEDASSCPDE